jgi:hypothetical protein
LFILPALSGLAKGAESKGRRFRRAPLEAKPTQSPPRAAFCFVDSVHSRLTNQMPIGGKKATRERTTERIDEAPENAFRLRQPQIN